jgi:hypothetical protein
MNKTLILSAVAITLAGAGAVLAAQAPAQPMSFFVAANPTGTGNLGGLEGADRICQNLAAAAGAGNKTWHAYLSTQARPGQPAVNARGRIGTGPWYNAKGAMVAANVGALHGDQVRDSNNIQRITALDERGGQIKGFGEMPNEHDVLTGSDADGRAFNDGIDHTCNNWTSDAMALPRAANAPAEVPADRARAMLGHLDRMGGGNVSWNAAHMSQGCSKQALINTGGAGRLYCFAIN